MPTVSTTDVEGQLNIDDTGRLPDKRIENYGAAVSIVKHHLDQDQDDRYDRIDEQALLDGQGPFVQQDLDDSGQGWRQNNNWGGALAKFEQALAPYHELENGVTVELDYAIKGQQREEWQEIIAASWDVLHRRIWKNYAFQNHNLYRNFVGFGVGIADFRHPKDFRFEAGGMGEHLFPRPMHAYEDAANLHIRVRDYREDELWEWYNQKKAEEAGFNKTEIERALRACNTGASTLSDLNGYTNNVYGKSYSRRAVVRLFNLRSITRDDKGNNVVSECMGMVDRGGEDYIYQSKPNMQVAAMSDAFIMFLAGIGNGELHSIKGLARKVFAPEQTRNQFINLMFDFARIYMSPMFESDSATAAQDLQGLQIGLFNLIPKGLKLVSASAVAPNFTQNTIPLLGFADELGSAASGIHQAQAVPAGIERTREEFIQTTMNNAVLTSAAVTLFMGAKERQYNVELKRLIDPNYKSGHPGYEMKEEWMKWCTIRGVPRDVIQKIVYVRPNRAVGGGSASVAQMLLEKAHALRPFFDRQGQGILDHLLLSRLIGPDAAKSVQPSLGAPRLTDQQHYAIQENVDMQNGTARQVLPDDDNFAHAQIHDAALPDISNKFAQGQFSEPQMLAFLNVFIPHQHDQLAACGDNKPQAAQIGQFQANLNKARQTQQHLVAKAQAEQNRLAQQAQAEQERAAAGAAPSGVGQPDPKLAQEQARGALAIQTQATLNQQEIEHKDALHKQRLAHNAQIAAQRGAERDATAASKVLDNTPPPEPTPDLPPPPDMLSPAVR